MSVEGCDKTETVMANEIGNTAEPEESIPVSSTVDKNEMQPNVDKVVHVTKIYVPPNEPNPTVAGATATTDEARSETVNSVEPLHDVVQSDGMPPAGSVATVPAENGELVPIQLQPTYPAAHPLPDVTVDVDHPEKLGELVPITIQPAYPLAHKASDSISTDDVVIPAYSAAHLPLPSPVLEESCPTIQIEPGLVRFGKVVTDGSASVSEVHSSLAEPLYPAAHPPPVVMTAMVDDDGMNEIPLPPFVEPGASGQISDDHPTANGTTDNVQVTTDTSRRRGIVLTVVLLVLLVSSFAVWSVYKFILKNSPA